MSSPGAEPNLSASRRYAWEGPRGEGWVVLQIALLLIYLLVPRLGPAWPTPLRWPAIGAGGLALLTGGAFAVAGALALGRQLTPLPHPPVGGTLVEHGPYRFVRHPIYSGVCLGAIGLALLTTSLPRLALALLIVAFFDAKARREERWLVERYPLYPAYRRRVRRLIPWIN